MWYVMQVNTGKEKTIMTQCQNQIPKEVIEKVFIPMYAQQVRFRGKWIKRTRILFPGYVFIATENLAAAVLKLKSIVGMTKLIGTGTEILPVKKEEEELLLRLGGEELVVDASEGFIVGTKVEVTEGPLKGFESHIRKIDRHRRKAWIEIEMFGIERLIEVGLEIVSKK